MSNKWVAATALIGTALMSSAVQAKDWQVKMLNRSSKGAMMAFEPAYVAVKPGDTVTFFPTDKGHNVESIAGMLPAGTAPFAGKINQQTTIKFSKPGLYAYKCLPHAGLGMVGLVQVGAATNRAQIAASAASLPPLAKIAMTSLLSGVR